MSFDESPFTCQCEKEDKKTEGFQIPHFYSSFSSEIMAVKGLTCKTSRLRRLCLHLCCHCFVVVVVVVVVFNRSISEYCDYGSNQW